MLHLVVFHSFILQDKVHACMKVENNRLVAEHHIVYYDMYKAVKVSCGFTQKMLGSHGLCFRTFPVVCSWIIGVKSGVCSLAMSIVEGKIPVERISTHCMNMTNSTE